VKARKAATLGEKLKNSFGVVDEAIE